MPKLKRPIISLEGFFDGLLPFLNNFLSTSILMAMGLLALIQAPQYLFTVPAAITFTLALIGMLVNSYRFVKQTIPNPVPETLKPHFEARPAKTPGWLINFCQDLRKNPKYIITGMVTLVVTEILVLASFVNMAINLKAAL
ncbi:hypothetical protein [Salinicola sp. RZ23]|uniref:hypothetical protein n=1 Tax=Salinicola sp. RZ23 TaxID=1949087 RepID=UPI000DA19236|nr:hypothetical protein [Salinicola sp. RZ23]